MDHHLTTDSAERKEVPIATGVLDYFPDALAEVARLSKIGNDKHNPGQPLHWARGKSDDHADCIMRHMIDRGTVDTDGVLHDAKVAWRALAQLQLAIEKQRATPVEVPPEPHWLQRWMATSNVAHGLSPDGFVVREVDQSQNGPDHTDPNERTVPRVIEVHERTVGVSPALGAPYATSMYRHHTPAAVDTNWTGRTVRCVNDVDLTHRGMVELGKTYRVIGDQYGFLDIGAAVAGHSYWLARERFELVAEPARTCVDTDRDDWTGRRVRCVNASPCAEGALVVGEEYVVIEHVRDEDGDEFLHFAAPVGGGWWRDRFELVAEPAPKAKPNDWTGRRIRCVNASFSLGALTDGTTYRVQRDHGSLVTIDVNPDGLFVKSRFELVDEPRRENWTGCYVTCTDNTAVPFITGQRLFVHETKGDLIRLDHNGPFYHKQYFTLIVVPPTYVSVNAPPRVDFDNIG